MVALSTVYAKPAYGDAWSTVRGKLAYGGAARPCMENSPMMAWPTVVRATTSTERTGFLPRG